MKFAMKSICIALLSFRISCFTFLAKKKSSFRDLCDAKAFNDPYYFGVLKSPSIPQAILSDNINNLNEYNFTVWPNFLNREDLAEIREDVEKRQESGVMKVAAVKGPRISEAQRNEHDMQQHRTVIESIRKTSTVWLDYTEPKSEIEIKLLMYLDVFRMKLAEELQLDLNFFDTEVLYAYYPIGGFYKKHSDSHSPGPVRNTFIISFAYT